MFGRLIFPAALCAVSLFAASACTSTSSPATAIVPLGPASYIAPGTANGVIILGRNDGKASTPGPPLLDLCPLPALASANLRAKPNYIELAISAIDAKGATLVGLKQSDFVVQENGNSLPIAYFRETAGKSTPVSLFIVGDASETMRNKTIVTSGNLQKIREALDQASGDIGNCVEAGAIVGGGSYAPQFQILAQQEGFPSSLSEVTLLQPFTTEHSRVIIGLENVIPSGPDHLSEATGMALKQLDGAHYPDRGLVILTDGLNHDAIQDTAKLLEQARASGIAVWIIGIGDPDATKPALLASLRGTSQLDVEAVKRLATAANGVVMFARPVDEDEGVSLAQAISAIGKQLGQGYAVGVVASSASAKPVVALANRSEAILRAAVVKPQVLADAAGRHPPRPEKQCLASADLKPPPSVSSQKGYTQLRVSVLDPDRKTVHDLKQSDFIVESDSQQLPVVYTHEDRSGVPRSIVIAIDTSGSMEPKLETVQIEIGKLIEGLNPCDQVALIAFSGRPFKLQDLTTDHLLVKQRLSLLHAYGSTSLYDAAISSVAIAEKGSYQDRALILVTDGMDNTSSHSVEDVIAMCTREHVQMDIIGIGEPGSPDRRINLGPFVLSAAEDDVDKRVLDSMAARTGGMDFIVPPMSRDDGRGFRSAVTSLSEQLENGYELGFIATSPVEHPEVKIANQPDYSVRVVARPSDNTTASIPRPPGSIP